MAEQPKTVPPVDSEDSPPPLLGSWRRVYTSIVVYLGVLIVLFYIFRRVFTP
jgi:hypothetical protein